MKKNFFSNSFVSKTFKLMLLIPFLFNSIQAQNASDDFRQAANKNPTLGSVNWINSILQQTKSLYYEGMAVPQRIVLRNLTSGTHTLVLNHQSLKNSAGRHAYDFLTSWDKAKQAAQEINPLNPLLDDLFTNACSPNIQASFISACNDRAFSIGVSIPAPPNPIPSPGVGTVAAKKAAFEARFPAQQGNLMIYASSAISSASLTFTHYDGGDQDAYYILTWTSTSPTAVIEFAGHLASGNDFFDPLIGWGTSLGSGGIAGAPFHIKLKEIDNHSSGSEDNQINDILVRDCGNATATVTDVACKGESTGSITVSITGGIAPFSYSINGGTPQSSNIFENLPAGIYSITVTDANGCTKTLEATINEPSAALVASSSSGTILCFGGTTTVTVSATGGTAPYTGTGTFTVSAGNYSYTVTDANGCTATVIGFVSQPTLLEASATAGSIACFGGTTTVTVTATGGTAPYTGTGTFTVSAGNYSYTVTDANGCTATVIGSVSQPTLLEAEITNIVHIICKGENKGSITISTSGGTTPYTYNINGGSFQSSNKFINLAAGNYTILVKDANQCTVTLNATVNDGPVCYPHYTYTQGYYGNSGGKSCIREDGLQSTFQIIKKSLLNGGPMILGRPAVNKTFTATSSDNDVNKLISLLPASSSASVLAGNYNLLSPLPPLQNGRIKNILLGQTITLWLNTHIPGNGALGQIDLMEANNKNYIVTIRIDGNASCIEPFRASCNTNSNAISSTLFPQQVINALITRGQGTTVNDLLNFASEALGGGNLYGTTLAYINAGVDAINIAFDGGKYFDKFSATPINCSSGFASTPLSINNNIGVTQNASTIVSTTTVAAKAQIAEDKVKVSTELNVITYPNPFTDMVNFIIISPMSGKATLEIINVDGKVIATVFNGNILAGVKTIVKYNATSNLSGVIIYKLTVGTKVSYGKLIAL